MNIIVYFALILICEVIFRLYQSSEPKPYKVPNAVMTLAEFNEKAKRDKLVLLDDIVLDVSGYMDNHPGGRFTLEHTLGTDISKFFYGGYGLDGNTVHKGVKRKNHSNVARDVVNTLAIARFVGNEKPTGSAQDYAAPTFHATISEKQKVNSTT